MKCILYLFVLSFLNLVLGEHNSIRFMTESKILTPGSDVNITCEYLAKMSSYHRRWTKIEPGGLELKNVSSNDKILIKDSRLAVNTLRSMPRDRNHRSYSLSITNVSSDDSGTYECQIYLMDGTTVLRKSSLFVFSSEIEVKVLEGDDVKLNCFPERYFKIFDVSWNRHTIPDGSIIDEDVLTIHSTKRNDSGIFTCRGLFSLNDSDRFHLRTYLRRIVLEVLPPIEVRTRNPVLIRPIGYDVNITCIVSSLQPFNFTWLKDNTPVNATTPDQQTTFRYISTSKSTALISLRLQNITSDSYGEYRCDVINDFVKDSATIVLKKPFATNLSDELYQVSIKRNFV